MTAPDFHECYPFDQAAIRSELRIWEKFNAAHPVFAVARLTILGGWLYIEGWMARPDEYGPLPTMADIPR